MSLDQAHEKLGWPTANEILSPQGVGAAIYVRLVADKLGNAIARRVDGEGVRVGVLSSDPEATDPPMAIICDFPRKVSEETLRETQKLAWNFGRALLLITIEPHVLRTWTCCEPPANVGITTLLDSPEIEPRIDMDPQTGAFLSDEAAASLHWVELLTGQFFQRNEARFKPEKRADQLLLNNLKEVRQKLIASGLNDDISHDLLARIIFIQFLFDRKDPEGKAALSAEELRRLHQEERVLSQLSGSFAEILSRYDDVYALFRWLNGKFNGDLFPGKGSEEEQEAAWASEQELVTPDHLDLLARFVSGEERMEDGQRSLWPSYAFDAIPLEFISTIYEEFVKKDTKTGVHYTPAHVADLILDSVLPWQGQEWNLKILDPACGSGVFLVKAYQRLIYRWKATHPDERISGDVLAQLLEQNLFGVDLDAHAVRVASFSLYLAMCDEIDPRDYWKNVRFPVLRGRRLIASDFFSEEHSGFYTGNDASYDLVIGNPPWGKNTATSLAHAWKDQHHWSLSFGDAGPLFLAKAIALTKTDGYIALLQPASTLLYNTTSAAEAFRKKLFASIQVEEVINFAALRHFLFRDAIVPTCAIVVRNRKPSDTPFWYTCPKPLRNREDRYRVVIEPHDIHQVFPHEVMDSPWVWSTLLWGGRRDLAFVGRLINWNTLEALENDGLLTCRQGVFRGDRRQTLSMIVNRRWLSNTPLPTLGKMYIDATQLPINDDPAIHSLHHVGQDMVAFDSPQLIIKKSWDSNTSRFRAAMVVPDVETGGVICSDSYLSVHSQESNRRYLEAACLTYNSSVAVYYLLLTSGRFAMDRNQSQAQSLRNVPLPSARPGILEGVTNMEEMDERVHQVFPFKEAEWLLVEDLAHITLPDYKGRSDSPGRQATVRRIGRQGETREEPELTLYCETFLRVLRAAYGKDQPLGAIIYSELDRERLPVRMMSLLPELDRGCDRTDGTADICHASGATYATVPDNAFHERGPTELLPANRPHL